MNNKGFWIFSAIVMVIGLGIGYIGMTGGQNSSDVGAYEAAPQAMPQPAAPQGNTSNDVKF